MIFLSLISKLTHRFPTILTELSICRERERETKEIHRKRKMMEKLTFLSFLSLIFRFLSVSVFAERKKERIWR